MTPFPLPLESLLGHWPSYLVYLAIGFGFGYVLEIAGFGKSTKLAAQFYLKEMTVLKVMFGAIITAMVLIFLTSALGLLDYNLIWVNPTYLWPGILGGLIMGVGFILGGFCPGTSVVAAATLKIDGLVFVLGAFFGIFAFGETVGLYEEFWNSSYMGRFTLPQFFNVDTGVVVLGVVLMALAAFAFAEYSERVFGKGLLGAQPRWRLGAAGVLVALALVTLLIGQPTNADRQAGLAVVQNTTLNDRLVQIHPGELLSYLNNRMVVPYLIDVRSETDFNAFHLPGAHHVPLENVLALAQELQFLPRNTLFVVMSNDETAATEAWRILNAESVPNVYILEGGINRWLDTFADAEFQAAYRVSAAGDDQLAYAFPVALGARYAAADPNPAAFNLEYTSKVTLSVGRGATGGGCG
ncbi:MAG: YeeE/YedE family protein [Chloroflexi bacterium]|nr:YeeE/YedE family protein [Chloroflexota bacterium]